MSLNPTDLARLKPQPKPYKRSDDGGLYIYVAPSGGKLWRIDYNAFNVQRHLVSRSTLHILRTRSDSV